MSHDPEVFSVDASSASPADVESIRTTCGHCHALSQARNEILVDAAAFVRMKFCCESGCVDAWCVGYVASTSKERPRANVAVLVAELCVRGSWCWQLAAGSRGNSSGAARTLS